VSPQKRIEELEAEVAELKDSLAKSLAGAETDG
jgi:ribosomal protein L29